MSERIEMESDIQDYFGLDKGKAVPSGMPG